MVKEKQHRLLEAFFKILAQRFVAFEYKEQDASSFYSYINIQHPNIKITMEREENHQLAFLIVLLKDNTNQGFITSVFHKKTPTLVFSLSFTVLYLSVTNQD